MATRSSRRNRRNRDVPTVSSVEGVRRAVRAWRREGERVAFVPTMGFLHDGHLSLVRRAARVADRVVVSVFVNPLQFGPREDFSAYPRDWARDKALLAASATDLIFTPRPSGYVGEDHATQVRVNGVARPLEGRERPGHFTGVATVVAKLLNAVEPDDLWLGQKDAQQVAVVSRMMEDLDFPARLHVGPTVRERDGLAMSSRNVRLSRAERAQAPLLYRALTAGRAALLGTRKATTAARARAAERAMARVLQGATLGKVDYAAAVDPRTFEPPAGRATADRLLLLAAVRFPSARLIDNLPVRLGGRAR
jgi:pantoate--beta-alanine ligase